MVKQYATLASALAIAAAIFTPASSSLAASSGSPEAQSARTLTVVERTNLKLVRRNGSTLYHKGTATGTLPGTVTARLVATDKLSGTVTIRTSGGTLTIRISGYASSSGTRAHFDGKSSIVGGTGRFAGAKGAGRFNGIVNRDSYAASVNTTGRVTY